MRIARITDYMKTHDVLCTQAQAPPQRVLRASRFVFCMHAGDHEAARGYDAYKESLLVPGYLRWADTHLGALFASSCSPQEGEPEGGKVTQPFIIITIIIIIIIRISMHA